MAGLLAAVAPGRAGAADLVLANLADQVQQAAWSQAAASTVDVNETVAQVTHAALASSDPAATAAVVHETVAAVVADVTPAPIMADGAEVGATRRAPPPRGRRAHAHKKARPRSAAAAASPLPVLPQASEATREPVQPAVSTRDRPSEKRPDSPGAVRESRTPSLPFRLPPLPFPFAMPSSVGVGSAAGSLAPLLVVALLAGFALFLPEVLIRRVPSRRPARPSRIVVPPWRPG